MTEDDVEDVELDAVLKVITFLMEQTFFFAFDLSFVLVPARNCGASFVSSKNANKIWSYLQKIVAPPHPHSYCCPSSVQIQRASFPHQTPSASEKAAKVQLTETLTVELRSVAPSLISFEKLLPLHRPAL